MKYVAGLDGGGTKTEVTVAGVNGAVVRTFTSGAINYNGQDEASVRQTFLEIMRAISETCGGLDACEYIVIGAAGVSNPLVVERMTSVVRECGYRNGLFITGDHETALYGALERPHGIILIAGTGSICYGVNESGLTHRTGGYGHLIDDEGSGYSIGRELLSAVVKASDGRIPATPITDLVLKRLQVRTVQQLIGFVYDRKTNKKDIAALAPILAQACELGDAQALEIADKSAQALAELALPVVSRLSMQSDTLAMAGSVLLNNAAIRSAFANIVHRTYPKLQCITAKRSASVGAMLMARSRLT